MPVDHDSRVVHAALQILQFVLDFVCVFAFFDEKVSLRSVLESRRNADACGGFYFVSGQHPDLNSGTSQALDRQRNVVLQPVFDSSDSETLQVGFELSLDLLCKKVAALVVVECFLVLGAPLFVL